MGRIVTILRVDRVMPDERTLNAFLVRELEHQQLFVTEQLARLPVGGAGDIHVRHMDKLGGTLPMIDFEHARVNMVEGQVRTNSVTDQRIISRMLSLPRERFVPEYRHDLAYIDDIHWLGKPGQGRFMCAPSTLARLVQLAEVTNHDKALVIGAATGYSTALVADLAESVVGLELDPDLAARAQANLAALDVANARIVVGDVDQLAGEKFDAILVEGTLEALPDSFVSLIADGGRLVTLMRRKGAVASATVFIRTGDSVAGRPEFNATLPAFFAAKPQEEFVF